MLQRFKHILHILDIKYNILVYWWQKSRNSDVLCCSLPFPYRTALYKEHHLSSLISNLSTCKSHAHEWASCAQGVYTGGIKFVFKQGRTIPEGKDSSCLGCELQGRGKHVFQLFPKVGKQLECVCPHNSLSSEIIQPVTAECAFAPQQLSYKGSNGNACALMT